MTDNGHPIRKILSVRRLALLGSAAVIGSALALGGPHGSVRLAEPAFADTQSAQQGPAGFADLVAKVKPAVISVRVKVEESSAMIGGPSSDEGTSPFEGTPFEKFFHQYGENGPQGRMRMPHHEVTGVGSGFFISADGYAVTNNHVVDHAKSVQVTTDDGSTYTAKVIGTDQKTDLALIKVEGKTNFPFVKFAEHSPQVGDHPVAD